MSRQYYPFFHLITQNLMTSKRSGICKGCRNASYIILPWITTIMDAGAELVVLESQWTTLTVFSCCMAHDKCYDAAVDNGICYDVEVEYIDPYDWTCENNEPKCSTTLAGCKAALCNCDKHVVDCWAKYPKPSAKVKCVHCNGLSEKMLAVLKAIKNFFASIPSMITGLFS